jgi:CRP-like cAMP-binding protein
MPRPLTETSGADEAPRNRLLGALPPEEFEQIRPKLDCVQVRQRELLFDAESPIRYVYFPETMVVSLVNIFTEGRTVEVGTAGCEGMAGLPIFLGDDASSLRVFAQIAGTASRMEAETFRRLASPPSAFHQVLLRYTQAFLTQVAQTAACNGAHLVDQRCARWLLMTHDRVEGDELSLTHEFLAFMLGVRRAGVTVSLGALENAGLVQQKRGRVRIVDRAGLEKVSCECYRVVRAHYERLFAASDSVRQTGVRLLENRDRA